MWTPAPATASAGRSVALGMLADRFGMAGAGALLLLLAIPAFLPVPLPTGIPAGIAVAVIGAQIALGLLRRDGAFVLAGYGFAVATAAWTAALLLAGAEILQALGGLLPAW